MASKSFDSTTRSSELRANRRAALAAGFAAIAAPFALARTALAEDKKKDERRFLIGDFAGPTNTAPTRVEAVVLVSQLDGTGSDPPPSSNRAYLLSEMRKEMTDKPESILALDSTSLALVLAEIPPGAKEGDRVDLFVRCEKKSETTSLRGGWVMPSDLKRMMALGGRIAQDFPMAHGLGRVVVDSVFRASDDKTLEKTGRVLGGARILKRGTQDMGLMVRREDASPRVTMQIASSINERFSTHVGGLRRGVAEPKNDVYIKLLVPVRYQHNLARFIYAVRAIPLIEAPADKQARMEVLSRQLLEPTTSANAALQLESIGKEAIPILKTGIASTDREVRFYAAEALAYLDDPAAAEPLAAAAKDVPAFRWHALSALTSMECFEAYSVLTNLLHVPSAETRYGAFRALRVRDPETTEVRGELLKEFWLHVVATDGPEMVHVTRSQRAEVVVFGAQAACRPSEPVAVGRGIVVRPHDDGRVKVAKFAAGEKDHIEYCEPRVADVVRALAVAGANYSDVVEAIHMLHRTGAIPCKVAVEAIANRQREYDRDEPTSGDDPTDHDALANSAKPRHDATGAVMPAMFADPVGAEGGVRHALATEGESSETYVDPKYRPDAKKPWYKRVWGAMPWSK